MQNIDLCSTDPAIEADRAGRTVWANYADSNDFQYCWTWAECRRGGIRPGIEGGAVGRKSRMFLLRRVPSGRHSAEAVLL